MGPDFFDIGYILSRSKDNKSILTGNIIPMACDILALFQGRPVMKRESKNHIEYENPDYSAFFHAILVIYQFADYIAGCLSCLKEKLPNEEMKLISTGVIEYVIQFLLKLENNDYPGLIDEFVDINLSSSDERGKFMATVTEPIEGHVIQRYNIDKEKVSFLHPIHSFLSWLIELSDFDCADEIVDIFNRAQLSQQAQSSFTGALSASLPVFEYPIRTTVLMSQIKSGFWVRNGFSVRSQLQLYKNTGLRENGYMRDIFLIQVFINTSSPNLVCFLLFNRWLLMDGWINKTDEGPAYDVNTLPYIIEECLSFFIHILSEDLYLRNLNNEKISEIRVRNEIIHSLCFGPMNYTKLCAQIPDHVTSEKKFDIILEELTSFISPTGSKDIGVYKLKEENFELLNPYYFNYTTNTKDEAIKFVKERIHKKTGKPKSEIVIMPQTKDAEDLGIYKYIGNFAVSVHFQNFLITTLKYILQEGVQISDILLETVLHLIHICAYEKAIDVEKYGTFYKVFVDKVNGSSIANSLYDILSNEAFKQHHSKIRSIYKVFGKHEKYPIYKTLAEEITDFNIWKLEENDTSTSDENEYDRKKRLAKERQKKLLNKFKKQQTLFLENNSQGSTDGSLTVMGDGVMDLGTDEDEDDLIGWKFPEPHCLLCQNAAEDAGPFGIITNISKSSEFRTVPFGDDYWFLKAFSGDSNLDVEENDNLEGEQYTAAWKDFMNQVKENNVVGPGFSLHENVESKLVSSSCGHGMHFQCYLNYLNSSKSKLNQITRNTPENIDHKEFLCPLCKSINNMFVPVMWSSNKKSLSEFLAVSDTSSFDELNIEKIKDEKWFQSFVEKTKLDISDSTNLTPNAMEMIELHSNTDVNNIPITNNNENTSSHQYFRLLLSNMFQTLSLLTFPQIFKADSVSIYVNTIKSTEIGLRGVPSNGSLVINQLSNNSLINLRTLNEFRDTSLFLKSKLKMELDAKLELFLKQIANLLLLTNNSFNVSVLERDFFDLLVTVFPLPRLGFNFNTILKVCFLGTILQNFYIISTQIIRNGLFHKDGKYTILDVPQVEGVSDEVARVSASIFRKFDELYRRETEDLITENDECYLNQEVAFGKVIYSMVMKATVPFLRRAAIYSFVSCADVENVNILNYAEESEHASEADKLCTFLNISNIHNTVTNFSESGTKENLRFNLFLNYMNETITEPKSSAPMDSVNLRKNLEYPGIVKLIDLPDRLDFFFTKYYYLDIYDNPHRCIENPAICLFCGKVVDVQKSAIGCKEGQCTTHFLKECSNSVGIFLLLKERSLLLLHKNGGSFMSAPYLDLHGELASEAKRGKTLYLMKPRYNEFIKNVWLLHDIPNYIARKLDSVMDAGGWDTL